MRYLLLTLALFTSGCANQQFYGEYASAWLGCEEYQCDALWNKAQVWLKERNYKIASSTREIIATRTPDPRDYDHTAYTLTREKAKEGYTKIVVKGENPGIFWGAFYNPVPPVNHLFNYLIKERQL